MAARNRVIVFSRVTLVAATELLEQHTQASFDQMVVRLGLEQYIRGTNVSVRKKCATLARIVVDRCDIELDTLEGCVSLGEAVVREAVKIARQRHVPEPQEKFVRALARDGFSLTWSCDGRAELRRALPIVLGAEICDEVHQLLDTYCLTTPRGHLEQALTAHTRSDWASANAQLRAFLESLLDEIAERLESSKTQGTTSENRRALLGKIGFFSKERKEWTDDGKNYINGLFKMLHTEGSHPGLSDEEHSTFRLHLVLVTARIFLRRLRCWSSDGEPIRIMWE